MEPQTIVSDKVRTTPRDFFLHLGIIVGLYVSAVSLLSLLFQIIDKTFPDALQYYRYASYSEGIRWAIASLIIFFPAYLFLGWLFNRDLQIRPERKQVAIRRWLVYLTLFIAGLTIVVDLVFLLNSFLSGEITVRFVFKVLSVLVVAGLIFYYYIYDLRNEAASNVTTFKKFALVAAVLVIASLVWGFASMGSPFTQRKIRFDTERVSDLNSIQWQIVNYWQRKQAMPQMLKDLEDPISSYMVPSDPETRQPYEYRKTGNRSFELCATFALSSQDIRGYEFSQPSMIGPEGVRDGNNWAHEAGRQCFTRTIDPQLYPPLEKGRVNLPAAID